MKVADKNRTDYCTKKWNFLIGCRAISTGCKNCWACQQSACHLKRFREIVLKGPEKNLKWSGDIRILWDRLSKPASWANHEVIWVADTSDLFHEDLNEDFIAMIFSIMVTVPHHDYVVLTKRTERMQRLLSSVEFREKVSALAKKKIPWPLPNVRIGTSAENMDVAVERLPLLLATPAYYRLVSFQPLLSAMDVSKWLKKGKIHWAILGAEAGPPRREAYDGWFLDLSKQCKKAGIPYSTDCFPL